MPSFLRLLFLLLLPQLKEHQLALPPTPIVLGEITVVAATLNAILVVSVPILKVSLNWRNSFNITSLCKLTLPPLLSVPLVDPVIPRRVPNSPRRTDIRHIQQCHHLPQNTGLLTRVPLILIPLALTGIMMMFDDVAIIRYLFHITILHVIIRF